MPDLAPGMTKEVTVTVSEALTAKHIGSGTVQVLATPWMIALMESTSQQMVQALLGDGQTTVGVLVNVRHLAATPLGMEVRVRSELAVVDGRRLTFKVEAFDSAEKVGEGTHERFVIDLARFEERLARKASGAL